MSYCAEGFIKARDIKRNKASELLAGILVVLLWIRVAN
jgi:hypothetical protein